MGFGGGKAASACPASDGVLLAFPAAVVGFCVRSDINHVAAAAENQALNAIPLLYSEMLGLEWGTRERRKATSPHRVFVINVGFRPFPIVGECLQSRAEFGGLSRWDMNRGRLNAA